MMPENYERNASVPEPLLTLRLIFPAGTLVLSPGGDGKLLRAEGLASGECEVSAEEYRMLDGAAFSGVRRKGRVISLSAEMDPAFPRPKMLSLLLPGSEGTLAVKRAGQKERRIGICVTGLSDLKENSPEPLRVRIDLLAPSPFFESAEEKVYLLRQTAPLLMCPLTSFLGSGITAGRTKRGSTVSVRNDGDLPVGIEIEAFAASGFAKNPRIQLGSRRVIVKESLLCGQSIRISTRDGEKRVEKNGVSLCTFDRTSEFFRVPVGTSLIVLSAEEGFANLEYTVRLREKFTGV